MKTLRLIKFSPQTGTASRYWEEDGFRRNDELTLADLTPEQQQIVAGAIAWATSQLPEGFAELESVELRKVADVVTAWTEPETEDQPPVPLSYSPSFVASIVGNGEHGQGAVEITSEPGPVADGMAVLWEGLNN